MSLDQLARGGTQRVPSAPTSPCGLKPELDRLHHLVRSRVDARDGARDLIGDPDRARSCGEAETRRPRGTPPARESRPSITRRARRGTVAAPRGVRTYFLGVAMKTAVREPFGAAGSAMVAMKESWPRSFSPSSQNRSPATVPPSSLSPVSITRSWTTRGPTKIPVVTWSSRVARNATLPLLSSEGGLNPNESNGPVVSATVVSGPPLPVTIADTN